MAPSPVHWWQPPPSPSSGACRPLPCILEEACCLPAGLLVPVGTEKILSSSGEEGVERQPLKILPVLFTGESTRAKTAKHSKQTMSRHSPYNEQRSETSRARRTSGRSPEVLPSVSTYFHLCCSSSLFLGHGPHSRTEWTGHGQTGDRGHAGRGATRRITYDLWHWGGTERCILGVHSPARWPRAHRRRADLFRPKIWICLGVCGVDDTLGP